MRNPKGELVTRPKNTILRGDGRVERICKHGVGHPLGHVKAWERWMEVHGCDGCCSLAEFWLGDYKDG